MGNLKSENRKAKVYINISKGDTLIIVINIVYLHVHVIKAFSGKFLFLFTFS